MELTEPVENINKQLVDHFGIDSDTGQPMFRVVWSEDQYEMRMMDVSDGGVSLLRPEARLVPKYNQWIHERWVLERLVLVPIRDMPELCGKQLSYEPLWVFQDNKEQYLPPVFWAAKFAIDCVYAALGKKSLAKYKDDESSAEAREKRINELQLELFGNETEIGDALAQGSGVGYTKKTEN